MGTSVISMDVGKADKLALVNKSNTISPGPKWGVLPKDSIRDLRAFRKDEPDNAPCTVIKTFAGIIQDISSTFHLTIPIPLLLVPFEWKDGHPERRAEVDVAALVPDFHGAPFMGTAVRLRRWQAELYQKPLNGQGKRTGNGGPGPLEQFLDTPVLSLRIADEKQSKRNFFRDGAPLSTIVKQLEAAELSHTGEPEPGLQIEVGAGIDVLGRALSTESGAEFIALGFGLGVRRTSSAATFIEVMIGPERVRLPVDEEVRLRAFYSPSLIDQPSSATQAEWVIELANLPASAFATFWNAQVARPHYAALATVEGSRDLSFVPFFENITPGDGEGRFTLAWRIRQKDTRSAHFDAFEPAEFIAAYPTKRNNSFEAEALFPELRGRNEEQFRRKVLVTIKSHTLEEGVYKDLQNNLKSVKRLEIELGPPKKAETSQQTLVRVGGLDLSLDRSLRVAGTIKLDFEPLKQPLRGRVPHVAVSFTRLGLTHVAPGGQDPTPDELLARDVLSNDERSANLSTDPKVPVGPEEEMNKAFLDDVVRAAPIVASRNRLVSGKGELVLEADETTQADRSRSLVLRIRQIRQAGLVRQKPAKLRATIIDPEPFQVAQVVLPPDLGDDLAFGDDTDGEFAVYRLSEREGQGWSLSRIAEGFDLYLPPQGIGEAMEKGKPWPSIGEGAGGAARTIDYRLSPSARFWLQDQEVRRRFAEAPWNLRRRFGEAGQRAPGTEVAGLRAELLYGLAMHLRSDSMRLAELGARIGALRPNLPAIEPGQDATEPAKERLEVYRDFRRRWANLGKIYSTRLAVLEPYRLGVPTPFLAEEGISFLLRVRGRIQGEPADLRDPLNPKDEKGLPGGATWGFESKNIYDETIENPRSTGGRIAKTAFTALGGSGSFTAEFAKGKTRIGADVTIGRTERYVVERIGRVGLVWNRAKHVIVYERTVLPTKQFQPPEFPEHRNWPVLRKVEEYVELLQPTRTFADIDASPVRRGMAEACVFRTVKIPVNGRKWGRDIPDGWIVPLWRPDEDPAIYPKPRIAMRLAATGEAAEPTFDAALTRPERLVFFTSTRREDDADTDRWSPVPDVDYVNAVRPKPLPAETEPTDQQQPDDLIEDPLYAAVTIPIDTAGRQTSLGAGRVIDGGLGATLESLTFMRAAPELKENMPFEAAAKVRRTLADGRRLLDDLPARLERAARAAFSVDNPKARLKEAVKAEAESMRGTIAQIAESARSIVQTELKTVSGWIEEGAKGVDNEAARFQARARAILEEIRGGLTVAEARTLKAIDDAQNDWANQKDRVRKEAGSLFAAVDAAVRSPWQALNDLRAFQKTFDADGKALLALLDSEIARLDGVIDDLSGAVNEARRTARDLTFAIEQRANGLLDQALTLVSRLPQRVRDKVDFAKDIRLIRETVDQLALTARAEIEKAGDISALRVALKKITNGIKDGKNGLEKFLNQATIDFNNIVSTAEQAVKKVDNEILYILDNFSEGVRAQIDYLLSQLTAALDVAAARDAVEKAAADIRTNILDKVEAGIVRASKEIVKRFSDVVGQVLGKVDGNLQAAAEEIEKLIGRFETMGTEAVGAAEKWALDLVDQLPDGADAALKEAVQAIGGRAASFAREALGITEDIERGFAEGVGRLASVPTLQNPESTLNLIRAAGQSPLVPNFKFNRDRIAYVFDDFAEAVRTSPMAGLVNRVGEDLKALGLRVPTDKLAERILPAELQNFDIAKVFPDLAGFKLDGLFRGIRLPRIAQDTVKVTHGFDRSSQTAWAKASSDVPLGPPSDLLAFGPLRLSIVGGRFTALADIVAGIQGPPRTKAAAEIVGDWQLAFGGVTLVTFERTRIAFDDVSGLKIDIAPDRVRFDKAIQFLSDLIKKFGDPESGFILELQLDEKTNQPIGVRAGLDLPLPPVAAGAFAASGIRLAASTALTVSDRTISGVTHKSAFAIEAAAAVGRPDEPFTLLVAFLNGGGYLTARALYIPQLNHLEAGVGIAIVAGVGADFSFGPARGSVYLQFGAEAGFVTPGSGLSLEAFLLIRGGVSVLNLITISLVMRLGITYQDGSVDARGYLQVSIKISRFFTHRVQVNVHYRLAGKGGGAAMLAAPPPSAHYLDLFA